MPSRGKRGIFDVFNARAAATAMAAGLAVSTASGQTDIFWNAGSGVWNASGNWSPANVPDTTAENARIGGVAGREVTYNITASLNILEVGTGTSVFFEPNRLLALSGPLLNDGFISLNPSDSAGNAILRFDASTTLSGSGILRLSGGPDDAQLTTNGTVLTNASGHTIDGAGTILATLVNDGVISAIPTGFGNRLELVLGTKTNNLNMQAGADAELFISGITINQDPSATIAANSGGAVTFSGNVSVNSGRFVGPGGFSRLGNGVLTLNSVSVEASMPVDAGATVAVLGETFNCTGTITLNDSASSGNGVLRFDSSSTLTGGGTVFLGGSGNDSQLATNGTVITIAPGFTVEGSVEIRATLVNEGVIRAFPSVNGDGRLDIFVGAKTNNALMVADPGGQLLLSNVTVNQGSGGLLLADGGEIAFNGNVSLTGGTLRSINGGTVNRLSNGVLTMNSTVVETDLRVDAGSTVVYLGNTLDCDSTIALNDSGSLTNAVLRFDSNSTLTGGGTVFLGGSGNDSQLATNGTVITIAPDFTVEGSGDVPATLVNNGSIRAFPSANGDGVIQLFSGSKTNNALMVAEPGGELLLNSATVNQGSGGLLLADGGTVTFNGNVSLTGGTLRSVNGGAVNRLGNGLLTMNSTVVETDLRVDSGSTVVYLGDVLDCDSTVALNDSGSTGNAVLRFDSSSTLTGGGTVFLGGSGNDSQLTTNGTVVTIASDFTVEGSGDVPATLINNGLIRAFPSDNGDGVVHLFSGSKTNNALMVAEPGGELLLNSATLNQGAGGLLLADGGNITFNGNVSLAGGTLRDANGGTIRRIGNGSLTMNSVDLEGTYNAEGGSTTVYNAPAFVNNGTVLLNSNDSAADAVLRFDANTVVSGTGDIVLNRPGNDSQINNNGTAITFGPGQTVRGGGAMNGVFTIEGRVEPGLPIGMISGTGTVSFADTTLIEAETDAPGSGDGFAFPAGTFNLDGTVAVRLAGYIPQVNDQFNLLTASAVNGLFDDVFVDGGGLPTNIAVRLVYAPGTVDVRFVCISDLAPPFGVLDLADITGFTGAFLAQDPLADIAEPIGVFDLADINQFIATFLSNCQ